MVGALCDDVLVSLHSRVSSERCGMVRLGGHIFYLGIVGFFV